MAVFKCKMCGGALEHIEGQSVATCEYCGTKQTLPRLDDEKRANLYDRANHFRRNNEFDKAEMIYEQILSEDGADAEAYWSLVLCRYGIEYVEDPVSRRMVPTVNRAQFTSVFDDENYKAALLHGDGYQKSIYEEEAEAINEIQKGILAISQKEEPFDIFICYKETDKNGRRTMDSVLAYDLYQQLTGEGFKVFFARVTLEDKLGVAYEPYIFAALNSAKVMIVLGTSPENFQAVWVKNEWSRYLSLVKQAGGSKVLIPAYKDMDPYELPEEFSHLQAQDMAKLGFMQDLVRGVKKIINAETASSSVNVVTSGVYGNVESLLKRAFLYLEDGDWKSAAEYCEKVLDMEPENGTAYLGKLLAELKCKAVEDLQNCSYNFEGRTSCEKVMRYGTQQQKNQLLEAIECIKERDRSNRYEKCVAAMEAATTEKAFLDVANGFKELAGYRDADKKAQECLDLAAEKAAEARVLAENARKDKIYNEGMAAANRGGMKNLVIAKACYMSIPGWKDADSRISSCTNWIEEQKARNTKERMDQQKTELKELEWEKRKAGRKIKKSKRRKAVFVLLLIVCILIILYYMTHNMEYLEEVIGNVLSWLL